MTWITARTTKVDLTDEQPLPLTKARQWYDELSEPGWGQIDFIQDDPALALIEEGERLVHLSYQDVDAFTFLVSKGSPRRLLQEGEEAAQVMTFTGLGHLALLGRMVVYPVRLDANPPQDTRLFNWTTSEYDDSSWDAATQVSSIFDARFNYPWSVAPGGIAQGWYNENAQLLWTADGTTANAEPGRRYFRRHLSIAASGNYLIQFICDNYGVLYVDGDRVIAQPQVADVNNFYQTATATVFLDAGDHIIAGWGYNVGLITDTQNPAGFAWALYPIDETGNAQLSVATSGGGDDLVLYQEDPPGMTIGRVMRVMFEEGQARGVLPGASLTFDDVVDTAGNEWDEVTDIAVPVGQDVLTAWGGFADAYADIAPTPGVLEFNAWRYGEKPGPSPAAVTVRTNEWTGAEPEATVLLLRAQDFWTERDSGSELDRREEMLSVGSQQSLAEVQRQADAQLAIKARLQYEIALEVGQITTDDLPYHGYVTGSVLPDIQQPDGTTANERVRSIHVSEVEENGTAKVAIICRDVLLEAAERDARVLRNLVLGDAGGSRAAQPANSGGSGGNSGTATGASYVWTTYTPLWDGIGGSTPDIGNGLLVGAYRQWSDGKIDAVIIDLKIGSTTDLGTHDWWTFGMPQVSGANRSFGDQTDDLKGAGLGVARLWSTTPGFPSSYNPNEREIIGVTMTADYNHTSFTDPAMVFAQSDLASLADYGDPPAIYTQAIRWSPTFPVDDNGDSIWIQGTRARLAIFGLSELTGD